MRYVIEGEKYTCATWDKNIEKRENEYHWKISVRNEKQRTALMNAFKDAGFTPAKEVFWHDYPGGAPCKGVTIAVTGKDTDVDKIMIEAKIIPIAWTGV